MLSPRSTSAEALREAFRTSLSQQVEGISCPEERRRVLQDMGDKLMAQIQSSPLFSYPLVDAIAKHAFIAAQLQAALDEMLEQ